MSFPFILLVSACLFAPKLFAQPAEKAAVIKKAMELNVDFEFVKLAKLFDTSGGRRIPGAYLLHSAWTTMRDKYGDYKQSKTLKAYRKDSLDYILEELEFDSGYVELKFGITDDLKIRTYLIKKMTSKEDRKLEEMYRIPAYANAKLVTAKLVNIGTAPFLLEGELTWPKNIKEGKKVPAVVLVHGSGPNDRNSKNGPQQPFKDIAYALASRGIAVLRYDKRTLTYADEVGSDSMFTVNEETVFDALAAVDFLRKQDGINPSKIIVLGHSLGGMVLPRIAHKDSALGGIIFMAAPAKSIPDKIIEQCDYLATLRPEKKKAYDAQKEEFVRYKTRWYDSTTKARYMPFGIGPRYWLDLDAYNQTEAAKTITMPMFFLQGGRDYQVTKEDFELWKAALKNNKNAQFRLFTSLNHLMATGTGPSTPEEYKLPANVNLEIIEAITAWVNGL